MLIHKSQSVEEALLNSGKGLPSVDLFSSSVQSVVASYDCYWLKQDDGLNLPMAIATVTRNMDSLFAEVATFHPNLTPLSAYTHICSPEVSKKFGLGRSRSTFSPGLKEKDIRLCVAIIIAEAMAEAVSGTKAIIPILGYSLCKQTLAYAISRARFLYGSVNFDELAGSWVLAKHLTNQEVGTQPQVTLDFTKNIFVGLRESNPACLFINGGLKVEDLLLEYVQKFDLKVELRMLREAYNSRMNVFTKVVEKVLKADADDEFKSSCIAYFCNAILPGSMTHVSALKGLLDKHPTLIHWYTTFACLSEEFDLRSALSGVCLKLVRDVTAFFSIEERPECDIYIAELEVLSRVSMKASVLKPTEHRTLSVALMPGINVDLIIQVPEVSSKSVEAAGLTQIDSKRLKSLLYEALELVNSKGEVRSKSVRYYKGFREE